MAHYVVKPEVLPSAYSASRQNDIGTNLSNGRLTPLSPRDEHGFVVVSDLVGDSIVTAIFEKQSGTESYPVPSGGGFQGDSYYKLIRTTHSQFTAEQDLDYRLGVLAEYRTPERSKQFVDAWVLGPRHTQRLQSDSATQTFVLHLIPAGASADYFVQGDTKEAVISFAGDVAMLLGGPLARLSDAGRLGTVAAKITPHAQKYRLAAAGIEASIAGVRLGDAYAIYGEDNIAAAGYLGEAFLRMYGVKASLSNVPSGRGAWELKDATRRGVILDAKLGNNTPKGFPYIDDWDHATGTAISNKTTDVRYRSIKAVENDLRKWARKINEFPLHVQKKGVIVRGKFRIDLNDINRRGLRLGIEPGAATQQHREMFERVRKYATEELNLDFFHVVEAK